MSFQIVKVEDLENKPLNLELIDNQIASISKWADFAFTAESRKFSYFEDGKSILLRMEAGPGAPWSLEDRSWVEEHRGCILEQTTPPDPIDAKILNPVMWYDNREKLEQAWIEFHTSFNSPLTESEEEWFEVFEDDDDVANEA
jgi:hypothetical protein